MAPLFTGPVCHDLVKVEELSLSWLKEADVHCCFAPDHSHSAVADKWMGFLDGKWMGFLFLIEM